MAEDKYTVLDAPCSEAETIHESIIGDFLRLVEGSGDSRRRAKVTVSNQDAAGLRDALVEEAQLAGRDDISVTMEAGEVFLELYN